MVKRCVVEAINEKDKRGRCVAENHAIAFPLSSFLQLSPSLLDDREDAALDSVNESSKRQRARLLALRLRDEDAAQHAVEVVGHERHGQRSGLARHVQVHQLRVQVARGGLRLTRAHRRTNNMQPEQ